MGPGVWLIAGPTASGKSALALRLAEAIGAEIVGADSMQVYADIPTLTARPTAEDMVRAPHHLVGTVDGAETWSTGRWLAAARAALADIAARGRPAVVVGGTGLYFRALTQGLADIPAIPAAVRDEARQMARDGGEIMLRERLAARDPAGANRIGPGDLQRLARAYEVVRGTGRSLSDWQSAGEPGLQDRSWSSVVIEPDREALYARCDLRLQRMVADGALEEVRALLDRRLPPEAPIMKAVGVREFSAFLAGETSQADALIAAQRETRRYVKRQTTWFRNQTPDWPRIGALDPEDQWRQFLAAHPALTG